jgi:hypothetical protein
LDTIKYDKIWNFGYETACHVCTVLMDFRQIYLLGKREGLLLTFLGLLELLNVFEVYTAVPLNTQVLWILGQSDC